MKFWILWWLLLAFIFHGEALECNEALGITQDLFSSCANDPTNCMEALNNIFIVGPRENIISGLQCMEDRFNTTSESKLFQDGNSMVRAFRVTSPPDYFDIYASGNNITASPGLSNLMVTARLPKEIFTRQFPKIVFSTFFLPNRGSTSFLSVEDQQILKYISLVGCSLSLVTMIIAVLIFITNKQIRADDTKKVHISLVIALILLNVHFLSTETAAKTSSTELCFYVAISLHYYLLATFSWMLLEGFHLYLLVVKVFNIYIKRYMLKASVVGWGIPAVIVSVVVSIDRGAYGHVALDLSNPNSTKICYITNNTVKLVSALGVFCLVFFVNVAVFVVIVKWVLSSQSSKQFGQSDRNEAKRNLCTLLSIMVLLGITWGLIFFSFGYLSTPGLYIFCIMNSLQGVFIFLYFVLSWKKIKDSNKISTQSTS
ncbi:adhesion G-protein coupled receptor G2-like isoform X2 [Melanotaenia boesemani]|uniref:adhesion G-protein coupled receptor G2-like isoform X2 n=1 Tax=Melanotaenia boesemani TaxID=1250792 RepID=UPI001C03FB74|nr:adhesion G-protein coupled receptor G2-like isoform X2 [Melanotaenia boesemani]